VNADVAGKNVTVKEATIRQGHDVVLKIAGNLANAPAPTREGKFSSKWSTLHLPFWRCCQPSSRDAAPAKGGGGLMRGQPGDFRWKTPKAVKCNDVHFDFPPRK
jgi:hypothetical protein